MKRRSVLAGVPLLLALALPGCGTAGEQFPDYRYRLTVEVQTPEGVKTGSSVIEVSTRVAGKNAIPTPGVVSHRVKGEAVAVDLGARGVLFALLRSDDSSDWASGVMFGLTPPPAGVGADRIFATQFAAMLERREQYDLSGRLYGSRYSEGPLARPMLVRFRDIADPRTVEKVDPDNLAPSFGDGITIKRITVQLTDDPVMTGIEKRLVWLPRVYEILHGPDFHPDGIPVGDFQRLFSTKDFK